MEIVNRLVVARSYREGGKNRWSIDSFGGRATILQDTLRVDTCRYTCFRIRRMRNMTSDPNVNCGLRVIIISQHRSIHCKTQWVTVVWDSNRRGGYACVGTGGK